MPKPYKYIFFILMSLIGGAAIILTWISPDPPSKLNMTLWIGIAMIWALPTIWRIKTEDNKTEDKSNG